ncbi:MAG: hypothetical protein Fur0018_16890 [Anaerolineales bacterium]
MLFILLLLFSTACIPITDYENSQEDAQQALIYLDETHQAQQTLILRRVPVESITLWIAHPIEGAPPATSLTLTLESIRRPQRVRRTYGLTHTQAPTASLFSIPLADFQPGEPVTLTLQVHNGGLWFYGRADESYPDGSLTLNAVPQSGDLAFRLTYDYGLPALWEDLRALLSHLWLLLPLSALLLLPGLVLEKAIDRRPLTVDHPPSTVQHPAYTVPIPYSSLRIPLSAAFWPVLLAWSTLPALHWTRPTLLALGLTLLSIAALQVKARRSNPTPQANPTPRPTPRLKHLIPDTWHLILTLTLVLAARLIMVRDLAAPPWVDSVHHSLLTRLILANGTYPSTYAPYAQTANAHYHSGFHALVAAFVLLSGLEIPVAMLILGQVLNALVSTLGVYTFARTLHFPHRTGLLAALIAGFVTPMPAYYLSWGRYTQLAGLLLLPAAFALWTMDDGRQTTDDGQQTADRPLLTARILYSAIPILPLALLLAGLLITHYRVAAFLALLILAWEITHLGRDTLRRLPGRSVSVLSSLLLASPWLWPALQGFIAPKTAGTPPTPRPWFTDFSWRYLTAGLGRYTLGLAVLGLGWALWRHRRAALTLILWIVGMFLLANLGALGLPGGTWVNNTSVEITLFLPIAALGGLFLDAWLSAIYHALHARWHLMSDAWYLTLTAILLAVVTFYGLRTTLNILNPVTILFHERDRAAMQWMDANLPPDALILINPAPWGYGLYVGADGGYWVSPLTGRRTLPPTLLYGWSQRQEVQHTNAESAHLLEIAQNPEALAAFMRETGAGYLYIGARGGPFSAHALQTSAAFQEVYHQGDTWIFALKH